MDYDCFNSISVCVSCWIQAATVADLSVGRMPFSCAIIKRKVAILSLSILPLDGRGRPSPQSWPFHNSSLPLAWRPWRTLRETFFRPASARARQNASWKWSGGWGTGSAGVRRRGAFWRVGGYEITENIGLFAWFPLFGSFAGGTPAPRRHSRFPPAFPWPQSGLHGVQC